MYIHIYISVSIHIHIYTYVYTHTYVIMYLYIYMYIDSLPALSAGSNVLFQVLDLYQRSLQSVSWR